MKGPALILVMTLALSAHTAWAQTGVGTIAGTQFRISVALSFPAPVSS